jgi:hypothetical protein
VTNGRTVWWAKDSAWWRRESIVELGEEFGPAGPAVVDWLACEAKAQNDGGHVKSGFKAVARGCFVTPDVVCHALSRSVTLGLLDDYEEANGRFTCRISGWESDQNRAQAAARKARSRAKTDAPSHGESRPVTESPPTGQDSSSSSSAAREPALTSAIGEAQEILRDVAGRDDADEISLANLIARFPSVDFIAAVRGCAEHLKGHPAKRTVMTLHRYLEKEPQKDGTTKRRGSALRELMGETA